MKVKLLFDHKAVILSLSNFLSKHRIKKLLLRKLFVLLSFNDIAVILWLFFYKALSRNETFLKSCSVWYAIWEMWYKKFKFSCHLFTQQSFCHFFNSATNQKCPFKKVVRSVCYLRMSHKKMKVICGTVRLNICYQIIAFCY